MSKRMRMITHDEYEKLTHKPTSVQQVSESFFHKTNQNAVSILDAKNIPDDIKLQLYGSVMSAVKTQLNEILNKPVNVNLSVSKAPDSDGSISFTPSSTPSGSVFQTPQTSPDKFSSPFQGTIQNPKELSLNDSWLLNSVPDKFKPKSLEFLKILKQFDKFITWNTSGRVTFFEHEFVPDSNLVDLVTYALRDVKFSEPPPGVNRFIRILKMINVPRHILSTEARRGFIGDFDQIPIRTGTTSRTSGFHNWDPIRSVDRHGNETPRSSNANVTHRKRRK